MFLNFGNEENCSQIGSCPIDMIPDVANSPSTDFTSRNIDIRKENREKRQRKWERSEDIIIIDSVTSNGHGKWKELSVLLPGRSPKQIRERYLNYLEPGKNQNPWTSEEDALLRAKHRIFGNSWNSLKQFFDGRSAAQIKNRWKDLNHQQIELLDKQIMDQKNQRNIRRMNKQISEEAKELTEKEQDNTLLKQNLIKNVDNDLDDTIPQFFFPSDQDIEKA